MPAATLAAVLNAAVDDNRAVAGLVVLGWEDAVAYVEAAEETSLPVILQAGPGCRAHTPIPVLGAMFRHLADGAGVPVVCHIDHATTIEECRAGIDHGFTSVMFDGSRRPLAENIANTAEVVAMARRGGVSTEGEVGFVGYAEGEASRTTDPAEAARFERETGVDALAVAVGNVHLQTEKSAGIDMEALKAIEAVTTVPLVLHGGSGIPSATRRELARNSRVAKFNIGTELRMAFGKALRRSLYDQPDAFDRIGLLKPTIAPVREAAAAVLRELGRPASVS